MSNLEMKVNALVRFCVCEDAEAVERAREELKVLMAEDVAERSGDAETEIRRILLEIGVPDRLLGHAQLVYAIGLAIDNPAVVHGITKVLYPAVAKEFGTTPRRAERAIRHAIEAAWLRGEFKTLLRYFGSTVSLDKGKPTNGEFIARIANVVRERM